MVLNKKQILVASISAVMMAIFIFCGCLPLKHKAELLQARNKEVNDLITQRLVEIQQIPSMKLRVNELKLKVGNFDDRIPDNRDLGDFLNNVTDIMQSCNLKEQLVQPASEIVEGDMYCIPIELNCKGSLEDMFVFFKSLKSYGRLMRIERIEFDSSDKLDGQVKMITKGLIYYQPKAG